MLAATSFGQWRISNVVIRSLLVFVTTFTSRHVRDITAGLSAHDIGLDLDFDLLACWNFVSLFHTRTMICIAFAKIGIIVRKKNIPL